MTPPKQSIQQATPKLEREDSLEPAEEVDQEDDGYGDEDFEASARQARLAYPAPAWSLEALPPSPSSPSAAL